MKIYLSPSNQNGNTYCIKPHTEQEICEEICGYMRDELTRCGIEACGWQPKIAQRIIEANSAAVDLYIAVHSNGHDSTARGVLVCWCSPSKRGRNRSPLRLLFTSV